MLKSDISASPQEDTSEETIQISELQLLRLLTKEVNPIIRISGVKKTHPSLFQQGINKLEKCTSISSIFSTYEDIRSEWLARRLFENVDITLEPTADGSPHNVCIHLRVKDSKPQTSIGVYMTDTSIPEVRVALSHFFSGRYTFQSNYIPPASSLHSWSLSFVSHFPWIGQIAEYYIGNSKETLLDHPADEEKMNEAKITISSVFKKFSHYLTLGCQSRILSSNNEVTALSPLIQNDFMRHKKIFLRHVFRYGVPLFHTHPVLHSWYPLPIAGQEVVLENQLATRDLRGGGTFLRSEIQGTKYVPLGSFISCQFSMRLGAIFTPGYTHLPINDRFFLTNRFIRGFRSVGPSSLDIPGYTGRYFSTGGNALWATSVNLNFPVPFVPDNGMIALHLFANTGNLRYIQSRKELTEWGKWLHRCSSVGLGIVLTRVPFFGTFSSGRLEFNFSYPLSFNKRQDSPDSGVLRQLHERWHFGLVWSSNGS